MPGYLYLLVRDNAGTYKEYDIVWPDAMFGADCGAQPRIASRIEKVIEIHGVMNDTGSNSSTFQGLLVAGVDRPVFDVRYLWRVVPIENRFGEVTRRPKFIGTFT